MNLDSYTCTCWPKPRPAIDWDTHLKRQAELRDEICTLRAALSSAPQGWEFPEHKAGMHISHNEHKSVYETVEEYTREDAGSVCEWVSEEEKQKAIQTNELWELQWYPETPIGFCALMASSLEACLRAAAPKGWKP